MASLSNLNELLEEHVSLDLECLDRIYLNAYVPPLQSFLVGWSSSSHSIVVTPSRPRPCLGRWATVSSPHSAYWVRTIWMSPLGLCFGVPRVGGAAQVYHAPSFASGSGKVTIESSTTTSFGRRVKRPVLLCLKTIRDWSGRFVHSRFQIKGGPSLRSLASGSKTIQLTVNHVAQ